MAKFYVQSGTLRAIIDSEDAERAALWAVHTAMEQVMPLNCSTLNCSTILEESQLHSTHEANPIAYSN